MPTWHNSNGHFWHSLRIHGGTSVSGNQIAPLWNTTNWFSINTICICESCETQLSPPLVFDNPIVELGTPVLKFVNMLWSSYMAPFSRCNRRTFAELIDDDVFFILPFLVRACHFLWSMAKNRRRESHKIREIKNAPPYPHLSKTKCVTNRIFLKINDVR